MATLEITLQTAMGEILTAYPAARLGLFRRYHIGGCSACGYQLTDTLEKVCGQFNISDPLDTIAKVVRESSDAEAKLVILPGAIASAPASRTRIIDARTREEYEIGHVPDALLLDPELTFEALDSWPKDAPVVFYSNTGKRGLEKASFFMAYGFTNVRNMAGGLQAWTDELEEAATVKAKA